jgi:hypothetical protein
MAPSNARVAITRDNAVLLLAAAEELGLEPGVVKTYEGGFGAPDEVLEKAGFDTDSGLPSKKAAKDAAEKDGVADDPDTVGSGNPQQRDHDITLTHEELEARDKAAAATSQEGAVEVDALSGDVATSPAQDQGEPTTTRPSTAKKATAKKATAKKATASKSGS